MMKTLRKKALLFLAVIMTSTGVVLAAEGSDANVSVRQIKSEQKKAVIRVTNLAEGSTAILRIKDTQGHVLHREAIRQSDAYMKKYDFSSLPSGEYMVELRTEEGTITESFDLKSGKAQSQYFKPAVQVAPGMIKVAFVNRIASPVSLKLYDRHGEVLYQETVSSQETFSKGLNVSKLSAGQYSLSIQGSDYVYSKSIEVQKH